MVLWFVRPCICLHAWGTELRQKAKYDITAPGERVTNIRGDKELRDL